MDNCKNLNHNISVFSGFPFDYWFCFDCNKGDIVKNKGKIEKHTACCTYPMQIHALINCNNGRKIIQTYCQSCSRVFGSMHKKNNINVQNVIMEFDENEKKTLNQIYDKQIEVIWSHLRQYYKDSYTKKQEWFNKYNEYLKSSEWKEKRLLVLKRDKFKCQSCGGIGQHIHHLSYETVFNEDINDLVTLCINCHKSIHND